MASEKTQVTILTKHFRLEGDIDLIPGARLTDFMNEAKKFMVVTNATVIDFNGKEILRGQFMNVSVENIIVILPFGKIV
jgi:acyl CoA:acetate/3-ketoacid CoA transferase beta subunit